MKKILLSATLLCSAALFSQTTLLSDNFESGSGNWTFSGTGDNAWIVNNSYTGYAPFVANTPNQPVSFTNSPQSYYLHIMNGSACGGLGICNASFDTGSASNQNATLSTGLNTTGMNTVTVNFWYLCAGAVGTSYGSLEYSINGGGAWINAGTYYGVSSWTQANVTLPVWDNQADFRIRFKWQNGGSGTDPAFAVDELTITAMTGSTNNIVTGVIPTQSWCEGTAVALTVNFTATGAYNGPNVYTAQLSNAAGSFAAPVAIGTLTSSASGSLMINANVLGSTAAGTGYRIRVVASDPSTIGSDNGTNLTIHPLPTVSLLPFSDVCVYTQMFSLSGGSPATGTYSGTGVTANIFDPSTAGVGTHTITYTYADGNGCSNMAQEPIVVDACASINEEQLAAIQLYPNPAESYFVMDGVATVQSVEIIELSGRVVKVFNEMQSNYDIQSVPSGTYFIRITANEGVFTKQMVIK